MRPRATTFTPSPNSRSSASKAAAFFIVAVALPLLERAPLSAADAPQWGEAWSRNQVSPETGLPSSFDPETRENVRWVAPLGTQTHSTPVVAGGRVYIGTNNDEPRDAKHTGDRGVLLCLDEKDGSLLWQLVVPKRDEDPYFDWPHSGISSPATVEGDRVYIVSNRGEVLCLDAKGLANGNEGPFRDEGRHMTPLDEPALEPGPVDADIVWLFDLTSGAGIWSHDAAHSSILIRGDHLYLNTGTGVDNTHRKIRTPNAPSLVVLDKHTGRLLAREREGIAPAIFHSTWSAPSMARVGDRDLIFFAAGNGIVYAFEALASAPPPGEVATLEKVWQFDIDPEAPKENVHSYHQNRREGPSNIYGMPVYHGGRLYVAGGGDYWWGKLEAKLHAIDVAANGAPTRDITRTGAVWTRSLERHVMSTPAIEDGLVYIADMRRLVYAIEEKTGEVVWTHEAKGEFWASPYIADGKLWIGTRSGDFWILRAGRTKEVLGKVDFGVPISATAVAANGTVYIATMSHLWAVGASSAAPSDP